MNKPLNKTLPSFSSLLLSLALLTAPATVIAAPEPPPASMPPVTIANSPHPGFSVLVERLLPAVVNISTTQTIKDKDSSSDMQELPQFPPGSPFEDFFKDFMEKHKKQLQQPGHQRKTTSLGSGFIIDAGGYVVTNNHVIQDADEITVILHDDTNLKAKLVGRDPKTDVALLKVESKQPLPYVTFGDSDSMKVGDWILVIGNPFGLGGTVTSGIISARARDINSGPYDDYIQTDAPINRGNSGGPMFDLSGNVIGINTAIFSPSGGSVGIGFAIPSSMAKNVVEQLKASGKIRRGWLGVRIQNVTDEIAKSLNLPGAHGALVSSVSKDSPAGKAGVQPGDVILTFDGKPVVEMRRLPRMVAEARIDTKVPMTLWRDGKEVQVSVPIGEMQEKDEAADDEKPEEAAPEKTPKGLAIPEFDIKVALITPDTRKTFQLGDSAKGLVVTQMGDNSPLIDKGLKPGDVIVEAGQKEMKDVKDFAKLAKDSKESQRPLLLLIDRQGDIRFVAVNAIDEKADKDKKEKK